MLGQTASLLTQLEELAYKLGIEVRYEDPSYEEFYLIGGLCSLRGKKYIFVNQKQSMEQQAKIIAKALRQFELDRIYIRPGVRDFIFGGFAT